MTDPYAETDDWPTVPATRPSSDAQPVSALEPSGSTPEAGEAARVARYAERAFLTTYWNDRTPEVVQVVTVEDAMAVTDQETAELRAEVERLRSLLGEEAEGHDADLLAGLDDEARLEAEVERLRGDYALAAKYRDEYRDDAHDASEALLNMIGRLEVTEAESARLASVVAKVEALLACEVVGCPCGGDRASVPTRDLRAALASAAPDTATPGEACSTCGQSMDSPPCIRSADGSISGHTTGGGADKCEATR